RATRTGEAGEANSSRPRAGGFPLPVGHVPRRNDPQVVRAGVAKDDEQEPAVARGAVRQGAGGSVGAQIGIPAEDFLDLGGFHAPAAAAEAGAVGPPEARDAAARPPSRAALPRLEAAPTLDHDGSRW